MTNLTPEAQPVQTSPQPQTIGGPVLHETHAFIQQDGPAPANPVALVLRLMRGRWAVTLSIALAVGGVLALLASLSVKPLFESEGLIRMIAREPKILFADRDDSRLRLFDAFVDGEATYLNSRAVLDRAYSIFEERLADSDETVPPFKSFQDSLAIKKLKGLIRVSAKGGDPERAQHTVNALLSAYSIMQEEQSGRRQNLRVAELETRIQELLTRRSLLESELLLIGEEYDASSLARAHLTKVSMLEELDDRLAEVGNSIARLEASSGSMDADTGDMEIKRATLLDRAMADMVFERAKRAAELEQMSLRYQEDHPKVARLIAGLAVIDDAIENRRRLIATLGKTGAITGGDGTTATQSIDELAALKKKLESRHVALSEEARDLNGKMIKLAAINAERSEIGTMLADTRRVLDQVLLESRNSLPGTAEVISRGSFPLQPISNKRLALTVAAFIVGIGGIALVSLVTALVGSTLRFSDDMKVGDRGQPPIVMSAHPSHRHGGLMQTLAYLQFTPEWQRERGSILAVNRFDEGGYSVLTDLARSATDLNLKVLLLLQGDLWPPQGNHDDKMLKRNGFSLAGLHQHAGSGLSAKDIAPALRKWTEDFDLVILDAGHTSETALAFTLNRLADGRIVIAQPGTPKRALRRLSAQHSVTCSLFMNALPNDPGILGSTRGPNRARYTHFRIAA